MVHIIACTRVSIRRKANNMKEYARFSQQYLPEQRFYAREWAFEDSLRLSDTRDQHEERSSSYVAHTMRYDTIRYSEYNTISGLR